MNILKDFEFKQRKYMPVFPKANGKPTVYIEGYPYEDDEPMAATEFHAEQITTFSDQLKRYFAINDLVHIGVDSFIYYSEDDITKCVAPDIHIVFGVKKYPLRRSFYTWAEGTVPVAVFEFLSDSTAHQDRQEKVSVYLNDIGVSEYFIHQPEMKKPAEFCGWRRSGTGEVFEIMPNAEGGLLSETLNLLFRWEDQFDTHVRLLRPYLPDGTPITTSTEEVNLRMEEQHLRMEEQHLRMEAEARAEKAERLAREEIERRQTAEMLAREETERRQALEAELERLRAKHVNPQN